MGRILIHDVSIALTPEKQRLWITVVENNVSVEIKGSRENILRLFEECEWFRKYVQIIKEVDVEDLKRR